MSPRKPMRQEKFPFGIAGVSVGEIERQVPAGEAPPLPTNDRLAVIGKSVPRINGRAKVTGAARFTVDIKLSGMLHARLLRSPHAHARIVSIDTEEAAEAALRLIKVEYEVLPFVVDMEDARKPDAPAVFRSAVVGSGFAGGVPAGSELRQQGNTHG